MYLIFTGSSNKFETEWSASKNETEFFNHTSVKKIQKYFEPQFFFNHTKF